MRVNLFYFLKGALYFLTVIKVCLGGNTCNCYHNAAGRCPSGRIFMSSRFLRPANDRAQRRRARYRGDNTSHVIYYLVFAVKMMGRMGRMNYRPRTVARLLSGCA